MFSFLVPTVGAGQHLARNPLTGWMRAVTAAEADALRAAGWVIDELRWQHPDGRVLRHVADDSHNAVWVAGFKQVPGPDGGLFDPSPWSVLPVVAGVVVLCALVYYGRRWVSRAVRSVA